MGANLSDENIRARLSQDEDEGPPGDRMGCRSCTAGRTIFLGYDCGKKLCGIQPYSQDVSNGCVEDACQVSTSDEVEPDGAN